MLAIIVLLYFIVLFVNLIRKPTETFVIENGKIYKEEFSEGYIIRSETIINVENADIGVVPIKSEGEKVAKGESVYRYYNYNEQEINQKIEEIDIEIQNNLSDDDSYFSTDIKLLNNQIDKKLDELYEKNNNNNIQKILQEKSNINTELTQKIKLKAENSDDSNLKQLIQERNNYENMLTENSDYVLAESSGVVSYRVDGFEDDLKCDDFSYLSEEYLNNLNIQTGQIIASTSNNGKIIDNFKCYITYVSNSDEAKNCEVGKYVKLRLQSSEEISAKIAYKNMQSDDKVLLVFEINSNVSDLIEYRKISFDVIWWSDSGLKVPNSAIKYEGDIAYVTRNRAGLKEKIYVKVLRANDKYSIVKNYSYTELEELEVEATALANKKSISVYDEIEL